MKQHHVQHKLFKTYIKNSIWNMKEGVETTHDSFEAERMNAVDAHRIAMLMNTLDGTQSWQVVPQE